MKVEEGTREVEVGLMISQGGRNGLETIGTEDMVRCSGGDEGSRKQEC